LRLALVRRHLAERGKKRRDRALLAERGDAHGFERRFVAGAAICSRMDFSSVARSDTVKSLLQEAAGCGQPGGQRQAKRPSFQARRRRFEPFRPRRYQAKFDQRIAMTLKSCLAAMASFSPRLAARAARWSARPSRPDGRHHRVDECAPRAATPR
jgi:hypothetical protein